MTTIYVYLRNEGVDVWRPVDAVHLGGNNYCVEGQMPEDEEWEFPPGSVVRCETKIFSNGDAFLTALERVS
jgi:hypothetical protein